MKKQIISLLAIVAVFAIFAVSMPLSSQTGFNLPVQEGISDNSATFVLETPFPEMEDTFPALIIKTPVITPEYVEDIGKRFGFTCEAGSAGPRKIGMADETGHLMVYEDSGAIWYSIPSKINPVVDSQPNLPSEDMAKKIAEKYLSEKGLLPAGAKLDGVVADKQLTREKGTGKILEEYNVTLQVYSSTRKINGVPVVGPGNKLKVYIGDNGEVVGLLKAWKDVEPYMDIRIEAPTTAYNELTAGNGIYITPRMDQVDKVNIKNISLAYWMDPADQTQEYVLPVFVFEGEALDSKLGNVPFKGYVPATLSDTPGFT